MYSTKIIKQELEHLSHKELIDLCLQLAKYTKLNKQFLGYKLFNTNTNDDYIADLNQEIQDTIDDCNAINYFGAKKKLQMLARKMANFCKQEKALNKQTDVHIHFCICFQTLPTNTKHKPVIINIYKRHLQKIHNTVSKMHPDLQCDYNSILQKLPPQP